MFAPSSEYSLFRLSQKHALHLIDEYPRVFYRIVEWGVQEFQRQRWGMKTETCANGCMQIDQSTFTGFNDALNIFTSRLCTHLVVDTS